MSHPAGISGVPCSIKEMCIMHSENMEEEDSLRVDVAENHGVKSRLHGNAVDIVIRSATTTIVMEGEHVCDTVFPAHDIDPGTFILRFVGFPSLSLSLSLSHSLLSKTGYDMIRFGEKRPAEIGTVDYNEEGIAVCLRPFESTSVVRGGSNRETPISKSDVDFDIPRPFCVIPDAGSNQLAARIVPCMAPTLPTTLEEVGEEAPESGKGVTLIVRTECWGLNFLDVLLAKGVIDLGPDVKWGGEFVGSVEAVYYLEGDKQQFVSRCPRTNLQVGDRVVAFNDGSSGWGEYVEVSSLIACSIEVPAQKAPSSTFFLFFFLFFPVP